MQIQNNIKILPLQGAFYLTIVFNTHIKFVTTQILRSSDSP